MSVDAAAADRLPWLPDEPAPQASRQRRSSVLPRAAVALVVVAAGGFWIGAQSVNPSVVPPVSHAQSSTTVRLPPLRPSSAEVHMPAEPQVRLTPVPDVHPSRVQELHIPPPVQRPAQRHKGKAAPAAEKASPDLPNEQARSAAAAVPAQRHFALPKPWNPRVVTGAAGRLVQIGAFGSVHQAKRGWSFMVHDYPAMAHLPGVVRETRNSKGRTFYRFDVGTTSQAHSEVLCQRMEKIGLSCAVVGLPWKAKVER